MNNEGWIPHDGTENHPFPWATIGEVQVKYKSGAVVADVGNINWKGVEAYRLMNGWTPIKGDGTVPEEMKGASYQEWEFRYADQKIPIIGYTPIDKCAKLFDWNETTYKIVAVRRRWTRPAGETSYETIRV